MRAEAMIFLEEGAVLLEASQKAVGLRKGTTFQDQFEANLLWEARTRSYPDAKLLSVANLHDSSANLF